MSGCRELSTPVVRLLAMRGPTTVAWAVGSMIVYPVQGPVRPATGPTFGVGGTWPHVCLEGRELQPSRVNRDSPPAVVGVPLMVRIGATLHHVHPDRVEGANLGPTHALIACGTSAECHELLGPAAFAAPHIGRICRLPASEVLS